MMDPDQFVIFIQMMDAIRCQIGAATTAAVSGKQRHDFLEHAEHLAEEAHNNAQYLASKANKATTEQQRRA